MIESMKIKKIYYIQSVILVAEHLHVRTFIL